MYALASFMLFHVRSGKICRGIARPFSLQNGNWNMNLYVRFTHACTIFYRPFRPYCTEFLICGLEKGMAKKKKKKERGRKANETFTKMRKLKAIAAALGRLSAKTDKWNRSALNFQRHVEPRSGLALRTEHGRVAINFSPWRKVASTVIRTSIFASYITTIPVEITDYM
ncbi:hypothetical protein PUN28_018336 [Cardiocondyla obscurior]|uniref:Uncharacterized protein n=1 Tax=Cardiocondyla obscurior TaxID=286306 RepID=A0AAW2ELJ7_9HYME